MGWRVREIRAANNLPVAIVAPEDILIDRLNQVVHWGEVDMAKQAITLLGVSGSSTSSACACARPRSTSRPRSKCYRGQLGR
jgi:hypothetical protein